MPQQDNAIALSVGAIARSVSCLDRALLIAVGADVCDFTDEAVFAVAISEQRGHGPRYPLLSLATIAICAAICVAEDWVGVTMFGGAKEDRFRIFLGLAAAHARLRHV